MSFMVISGGFTTLPNETARDRGLSIAAKGILIYLRSHDPGYVISKERIYADHPKDSHYALDKAMSELTRENYIKYTASSEGRGRISRTRAVHASRVSDDMQPEAPENLSYDDPDIEPMNSPAETPSFPSSVHQPDIQGHVRPVVYKKTNSKKTKEDQETPSGVSTRTTQTHPIPDDYEPSSSLLQWASDKHGLRYEVVIAEIEIFRDHHLAKGSEMKNWDAAARTWLARVRTYAPRSNGSSTNGSTRSTSDDRAEQALRAGRELAAEIAAGSPYGLLEGGGYQ